MKKLLNTLFLFEATLVSCISTVDCNQVEKISEIRNWNSIDKYGHDKYWEYANVMELFIKNYFTDSMFEKIQYQYRLEDTEINSISYREVAKRFELYLRKEHGSNFVVTLSENQQNEYLINGINEIEIGIKTLEFVDSNADLCDVPMKLIINRNDGAFESLIRSKFIIETNIVEKVIRIEKMTDITTLIENWEELFTSLECRYEPCSFKKDSLKVYDEATNIELNDESMHLWNRQNTRIEFVIVYQNEAILVKLSCEILTKDESELCWGMNRLKNTVLELFEFNIGKTINKKLINSALWNFLSKQQRFECHFKTDDLEFYKLNSQELLSVDDIRHDVPFTIKTNIVVNTASAPITFNVKLVYTSKLRELEEAIEKLRGDVLEVYIDSEEIDLNNTRNTLQKTKLFDCWFYNNCKIWDSMYLIMLINNIQFSESWQLYVRKTEYYENTDSKTELNQIKIGDKVSVKGILTTDVGDITYELDLKIELQDQNFSKLEKITSEVHPFVKFLNGVYYVRFNWKHQAEIGRYLKIKNYPNLSKSFIIKMIQDIINDKHANISEKYLLENWFFLNRKKGLVDLYLLMITIK